MNGVESQAARRAREQAAAQGILDAADAHNRTAWAPVLSSYPSSTKITTHIGHIEDSIQQGFDMEFQLQMKTFNLQGGLDSAHGVAPLPDEGIVDVGTYSHLFCPFIWQVLTKARNFPLYRRLGIPEIPADWLTYGRNSVGLYPVEGSRWSVPTQTSLFYTGEQNAAIWNTATTQAANDQEFVCLLLTHLLPQGGAYTGVCGNPVAAQRHPPASASSSSSSSSSSAAPSSSSRIVTVSSGFFGSPTTFSLRSGAPASSSGTSGAAASSSGTSGTAASGSGASGARNNQRAAINELRQIAPEATNEAIRAALRNAEGNMNRAAGFLLAGGKRKAHKTKKAKRHARHRKQKSTRRR